MKIIGYANEVGEAFRPFIGSKWVAVAYGVATLYSVADTVDKTFSTYKVKYLFWFFEKLLFFNFKI